MRTRIVLAALLLVAGRGSAVADNTSATPIVTDRPSVTDSSVVVPAGSVQAENGFADTWGQGQQTWDGPETLLRIGVASNTELRFTAPDYSSTLGSISGFGDAAIGVKQQLGPTPGSFDVSLILSLTLPAGPKAISTQITVNTPPGGHAYQPSAQLPWSRMLSSHWTVAGMLSVYWLAKTGYRNLTGETTLLLDRQLRKTWDAFLEYAGDFPQNEGPRHLLHFGTLYRITPRQQLDFHVGVGLSAAAVDHFFGAGYSFRLQAVRH
jgi:hypothetical protein